MTDTLTAQDAAASTAGRSIRRIHIFMVGCGMTTRAADRVVETILTAVRDGVQHDRVMDTAGERVEAVARAAGWNIEKEAKS